MGMAILIGMGFSWESHGNGNNFWATNRNGNWIGTSLKWE